MVAYLLLYSSSIRLAIAIAKAIASLHAVLLYKALGFQFIWLEGDAKLCSHVGKAANTAAHLLAKEVLGSNFDRSWEDVTLDCIAVVIWDYDHNQQDEIRRAYIRNGKDPNSFHRIAEKSYDDLKNQSQHIQNVFKKFTSEQIANNQLQLKASIDVVRVLAFQGVAFRGRDESVGSKNRGNFLEISDLTVSYNKEIAEVIAKAPKNASYTSPKIQKEMLHVFSTKVKKAIRDEIGNAKFCIIVDKACDESMKEQMAIVLRFVDKNGFVRERFFGLVQVSDTVALILKKCIYFVLSKHGLDIQNIRGLGYDGASNMRELRVGQAAKNAYMIEIDEIEIEKGLNQIRTLQWARDTRWSSHLRSVSNLIKIFSLVCEVIVKLIDMRTTSSQRAEADSIHQSFCNKCNIDVSDMNARYVERRDSQLQELNRRFSEDAVKLLILGSALDPRVARESFRIDDICQLFNMQVSKDCQIFLNYANEWAFSAMNIVKIRLRNKIEDEFLTDSLMLYIEREIAATFSTDSIIDDLRDMKKRKVPF
ncbi:uncharacterized protein LOC132181870 [Corylus avellana]|uniref:uncharacterized protein LOC132181870 n=1 Tax=Corylus avellana TaxID=13451 RepID=UPI00286BC2FB|nr:uncharacterized protein LOC132181870 [Corylus avellana]